MHLFCLNKPQQNIEVKGKKGIQYLKFTPFKGAFHFILVRLVEL